MKIWLSVILFLVFCLRGELLLAQETGESGGGTPAEPAVTTVRLKLSPDPPSRVFKGGEDVLFEKEVTFAGASFSYETAWRKVGRSDILSTDPSLTLEKMTAIESGKYYCLIQETGTATVYSSDTLEIKVVDTQVNAYGFTRLCLGDSVGYGVAVSDTFQYTYTWYHLPQAEPVGHDEFYIVNPVTEADAGLYYCKVVDETHGFVFLSDTLDVMVSAYPQVGISVAGTPNNADKAFSFCYGTEVTLTLSNEASDQPEARFLWTGSAIEGNSGDASVKVRLRHSGVYRAMITNNGCVREDSVSLRRIRPDVLLPETRYVIEGESITLQSFVPGDGYTYSWTNGTTTGASSDAAYTFTALKGKTAVALQVRTNDALGCENSDTCYVVGLPKLNYTTSVNDGYVISRGALDIIQTDTVLCARQPLTLEVAYTGYDGYTYEWMKIEGGLTSPADTGRIMQIASAVQTSVGEVKYFCRAYDLEKNGYAYSDTVKVVVKYTPLATITAPDEATKQCGGYPLVLQGKDAGVDHDLSITKYTWQGSGIQSGAHTAELHVKVGVNGYYTFETEVDGCRDTADIHIPTVTHSVDIASQLILPQPTNNVLFTAAKPDDGMLTWYPNGDENRKFRNAANPFQPSASLNILEGDTTVIVKMEKEGCHYYDTCIVLLRQFVVPEEEGAPDDGFAISYPILRVTSTVPRVCLGRDITLSVYDLGYDNYKYEWRKVGAPSDETGLSDSISYTIFHADASVGGRYYCVATDPENPGALIYSDTLLLTVDEGPLAEIVDSRTTLCYGEEVEIRASTPYSTTPTPANPTMADQLVWSGEGIIDGQGTNVIRVKVGENAYYRLRASKNNACWSEDTISFRVVKPAVSLEPPLVFLSKNGEVELEAVSEQTALTWFKDGVEDARKDSRLAFTFDADGEVAVIVGEGSCRAMDTARVFIKGAGTFVGGENDGFVISQPALRIPSGLKNIYACPDTLLVFGIDHQEFANYKYQWWKVTGETPTLVYDGPRYAFNVREGDGGEYYCTAVRSDAPAGTDTLIYSDTLYLQVNIGPIAQITHDDLTVCYNGMLHLDASASANGTSGEVTYTWIGEGVRAEEAGQAEINVFPKESGFYTVRVSNSGCSDTAAVKVEVVNPHVGLPDRLQLAAPDPAYHVDADIPEGVTVKWSFRPEGTGELIETPEGGDYVNVTGDGWILAEGCVTGGCSRVDSCHVFVHSTSAFSGGEDDGFGLLEVITRVWIEPQFKEIAVCLNNRLSLKAVVSGLSRYTYSWHRLEDDTPEKTGPAQGTEAELNIDYMNEQKAGHFYCVVTDMENISAEGLKRYYYSDTVEVTIKEGPLATVGRMDGQLSWDACVGNEIELVAGVQNGFPSAVYEWSGDYFESTLDPKIIVAKPHTTGSYLLTVKDEKGGCQDTLHVQFNMHSPEVHVPATYLLAKPGAVSIPAEANGTGDFTWYLHAYQEGNPFSSDNPVNVTVNRDETVIVRFEQEGCYGFDTAQIYVKNPGTFAGNEDDGFAASDLMMNAWLEKNHLEVCRGWDIRIPLHTAEVGRVLRYKWYKVGDLTHTILSEEDTLVLRANSMADAGKYYCIVADPAIQKTISSDTAEVTLVNGPLAQISLPTNADLEGIFCRGGDVKVSAAATEGTKVNPADVYTYEWFGENISYTARDYEITAHMFDNGRYIVKASLGECYTYDTVDMQIYEPEVHVQPVIFLSKAEDVTLSVDNPDKNTINWRLYYNLQPETEILRKDGDTLTQTIYDNAFVIVERYESKCVGRDTCRIFVRDERAFKGSGDDGFMTGGSGFYNKLITYTDVVCEGEVATLYIPVVGDDFYRYKWIKVGEESRVFPSSPLCKFPNVTKQDEGYYYCIVTDVNNNKTLTSERVFMQVKELPKAAIKELSDTEICYGETVTLEADPAQLKPDVTYSYLWSGRGIGSRVTASTDVKVEADGDYTLLVSDGDCYISDTISLKVRKTHLDIQPVYHIKKGDALTLQGKVNGSDLPLLNWRVGTNYYEKVNPLMLTASSLTYSTPFTVSTTDKCAVTREGYIYVRENTAYEGGNDDGYVLPNNLPQLLDQCDQLLGCDVDTAVLWVTAIKTEDLIFRWEKYSEVLGWRKFEPAQGDTHVSGADSARLIFSSITDADAGRYRCQLRNTYGYTYSREIRLVKGGIPDITPYPLIDNQVCEKTEFRFVTDADISHGGNKNDTGLKWKWYYSKDGINFTQLKPEVDYNNQSLVVKPCQESDEGYYMVEAENFCGSVYDTAFQEIWEAPSFVEQPTDQYVCNWGTIELTTKVKGGGTYFYSLWQVEVDDKGNYLRDIRRVKKDLTVPSYTFGPAVKNEQTDDSGYYQWRVRNQCDSARSKLFRITVEEEIQPDFEGVDTTVCAGVGGNLVMETIGNVVTTPTMKYTWKKNGTEIPGATENIYTIVRVDTSDAGVYICYAGHSCAAKPIKQYNVRTKSRPQIILQPSVEGEFCESGRLDLQVDYTSDAGPVTCQWQHNNLNLADDSRINGAQSYKLHIDTLYASDGGWYSVTLRNDCELAASQAVWVQVNEPARFSKSLEGQNLKLCVGSSATLSVTATGLSPIMYTWWKDGQRIEGANLPSLTLAGVDHEASGTYKCSVQNLCSRNEGEMSEATVEVITPRKYKLEGAGGYCGEDFREITLSGFEKGVTYVLKRRNALDVTDYLTLKTVDGDTVSTPKLTFGYWGAGYYHVEARAIAGSVSCEAEMSGEIYIFQKPTPEQFDFVISDPMCTGEPFAELTLVGTETKDVEYYLQNYVVRFGMGAWNYSGAARAGDGNPIVWDRIQTGVYRVMALHRVSGCQAQMGENDTVAVRPYPAEFDLFAVNGDTTACYGMRSDVVLQLSDSEKTCKYTLYKDGVPTDRTVTGNLIQWEDVKGGNYSVHAETNYGCTKDMGNVKVTDLPQLKRWFLTGSKVFCEEEAGDLHYIMQEGSTSGIRYNFYALSSGQLLDSVYGNGEFLVWEVPLEKDETYYVEAVDTVEGCIQAMADSIRIAADHLNIAVIPDTTIIRNTSAELWIEIWNAMGTPQVNWLPQDKVLPLGGDTYNVNTTVLKEAELFAVTVKDDYCSKEATVQVNVEGQELIADLRKSDCFTSLDTLFLCEGDEVSLCAFVSGGGKEYYFSWSDDYYTDSIPVPHRSKITYTRHELRDGFVRLEVNSIYKDVLQVSVDTVFIRMRKRPDIFLANQALTCVVPGTDTAIMLTNTEKGVEFQLNYRPVQTVAYTLKDTLMGDGRPRRFPVTAYADAEDAGFYQLKAIKTYPETTCVTTWPAIQLRRGPQRQVVSSGDITVYCADERQDTIYVPATETDVVYHLIKDRKFDLAQQAGNGGELRFSGSYGTGTYQVTAVLGNCVDTMSHAVEIVAKPRPIIDSIQGMQDYCVADTEIKVTVVDALPVISYTLYKEGFFDKIAQGSIGLGGENIELPLTAVEGLDDLTGNYFVVAYNPDPSNQCSDTVRGMAVTPDPGKLTLNSFTYTYCDNLPGYEGKDMIVTGADPLIRYELMDQSLSNKIGDFVHTRGDTIVYDGLLSVEGTNASYKIYAKAGGCSGVKGNFEVKKSIAPSDVALSGDTLGCVGYDLVMGVATPAMGVEYSLYREGETEPLRTLTGGSGRLQFGAWNELGTYYVVAKNAQGCERRLSREYKIRELPQLFRIYAKDGVNSYCEGERGVQLGITGTQFGVTYFIQKWDTLQLQYRDVAGGELSGSGANATLFAGYYQSGSYRIRTSYCDITMLDTLEITERPLPLAAGLEYEGRACIDSAMSILVKEPEEGTNYTLLYNGSAVEATALPGGAEVKWNLTAAENGVYTVSAEKNNCSRILADKIEPGEVVRVGDLQGIVSTMCEMERTDLYLEEWESKAAYTLYTNTDTALYKGKEADGKLMFKGVPAGFDYYITASHKDCKVEKGAFGFHGVGLPELPEGNMLASDCLTKGEAAIQLKDLKPTYQYILEGLSETYRITAFAGDTLIEDVDYGTYTLKAYDPLTTCTSLPLKATVRIGLPQDSIVSDLVYCEGGEGVKIRLSGQTYGVLYKLLNAADGSEVEQMSSSTSFNKYVTEGRYVYYRERTGLWGGCQAADTFEVKEYPYPNTSLQLELPAGALCEAGDNAIVIRNSEKDVHYILQNSLTKANLDTIYGTGDPISFSGRKPVGSYNILIRYKGVCEKMYYKALAVSGVPAKAVASDGEYCLDTEGAGGQGCNLSISGLKPLAEYVLFNRANEPLDTLYGVNAGSFKTLPAGDYYVTGTYTDTRCADVVAEMSIRQLTQPRVYPISNMNGQGDCASSVQVVLGNGCEGDSVKYYLYMDGFYKVQGPVTALNNRVTFDNFTEPGKYSVYAVKGEEEKCGNWMEGDVVLYDRPRNGVLHVNGYNCSNISDQKQVTIWADKTEFNWNYYISDGVSESVKQEGNPNTTLSWDEIGGHPLASGRYVLYARNACDTVIAMDTVQVYDAAAPAAFSLKKIREGVVCDNSYDCYLEGNEKGVTYILNFHNEVWETAGEGNGELYLGSVAPTSQKGDMCRVYARVDSSQCVYAMDSLLLIKDSYAEDPGFKGPFSQCLKEGDTIKFILDKKRVPLLDYYLELNGHFVDTIHGDAPPALVAFQPQFEPGCYNVYATSKTRQCDKVYPAKCASVAPEVRSIQTGWNGELCEGESREIVLEDPQVGVQYYLLRNGAIVGDSVNGTDPTLVVGSVTEAGLYTVLARVTDECTETMEGEINVKVNPLPELHVPHELNYVEGGEGVKITVQAPTSPGVYYQLDDESGKLLYWKDAALDGGALALNGNNNEFSYKAGKYIVSAYSTPGGTFKCTAIDSIEVKEVGVEKFRLEVIGNPYMCEPNECRKLRLSGSENGTYYELYRRYGETTEFVASAPGTGKIIDFAEQCDTGYYYVMASREIVNGTTGNVEVVKARMGDEVHLYVVSKIERFNLVAAQNGYCYQDPLTGKPAEPAGSVILQGSQSDLITYQLYCDGQPVPGGSKTGTAGGVLKWDKLSGKTCIKNTDAGNVYTVIATDGKCEVEMPGSVNIVAVNKPTLVQQPTDMLTCTGQEAAMIVQVDGCLLNYEWSSRDRFVSTPEGDVLVKGKVVSTSAGYKIDSVGMEDMGIYDCRVSNYCGEMEGFVPVKVSVREVVRIPEEMPDRMVCGSTADSVQLVSAAVGENYYWYRAGAPLDTLSKGLAVYTLRNVEESRDAGEYVCCTWNSCGALYDTIRLEFNRQPEVNGFVFREDTLCKGSEFVLNISSRDTLYWYKDNQLMKNKHDFSLQIDSILPQHAGLYKVVAKNECLEGEFNLVRLYVDDTLKPVLLPEALKHYCIGTTMEMSLEFQPSERIHYKWYKRNIEMEQVRNKNRYSQTVTNRDDGAIFGIEYANKCTSGFIEHIVNVDRAISLGNFASDSVVSVCTGESPAEVVIRDYGQDIASYDHYKWYKQTAEGPLLVSETDTLRVDRKVSESGIFYCEVSNTCANVTSGKFDLRVDSLPLILTQPLPANPYCQNTTLEMKMRAQGGDLIYTWYGWKKTADAPEPISYWKDGSFISEAKCTLKNLALDMDSCRIWCVIENGCGYVLSDTVVIRVNEEVRLTADREIAYLCPGEKAKVVLKPSMKECVRWEYAYAREYGAAVPRSVYAADDTLRLTEEGTYRIFDFLSRDQKCYEGEDTLTVNVMPHDLFYASLGFVGRDTVCRGEPVYLKLSLREGEGPWRVDIRRRRDEVTAPEIGGVPVEVWQRDTVFELTLVENQKFYIASAVQFADPDACAGIVEGEDAAFVIQQRYGTYIGNDAVTHFGACQQLNLPQVLQPYPDASIGKFYINGKPSEDNILKGDAGKYHVVYKAETSAGCADSAQVDLWLDTLPSVKLTLEKQHLCHQEETYLTAQFSGSGDFKYTLRTLTYGSDGKLVGRPGSSSSSTSNYVTYGIGYKEDLNASDSLRLYTIAQITDRYGCRVMPKDTVKLFCHRSPQFLVKYQDPETKTYVDLEPQYYLSASDKKGLFFMIISDKVRPICPPWMSYIDYVRPDGSEDSAPLYMPSDKGRIYKVIEPGTYEFKVSDAYCPSKQKYVCKVVPLDTGYLQVRVLLEGAYNNSKGLMESALWPDLLPNQAWGDKWPELGAHKGIDWITLELRTGHVNGPVYFSGQFLLRDDGWLIDRYGRTTLPVPNADFSEPYYVVVKHRNHLTIGAKAPMALKGKAEEAELKDMRLVDHIYFAEGDMNLHITFLGQMEHMSVFGMCAGNVLGNALISISNANKGILEEILTPGYYETDVNFDGKVTVPGSLANPDPKGGDDVSIMYLNRDKYSDIK